MPVKVSTTLEHKLAAIERLARGGKLSRFLHDPLRYCRAIGYWRLIYPLTQRGKFAAAHSFFGLPMQVVLPSATEIYLFGAKTHDSEIRLTRFLLRHLRPSGVFVDVGAHFGFYTLLASQLVSETGRVISIEASATTFAVLEKNAGTRANVSLLHRAATDTDTVLSFNEYPVLYSEYNSLISAGDADWARRHPPQKVEVRGVRLDDVFQQQGCLPTMVKIDAEGAELQVLRGMEKTLGQHSPLVVAEHIFGAESAVGQPTVFSYLKGLGYSAFVIDVDGGLLPLDPAGAMGSGLGSENLVYCKGG